jgi:hypothetical protein
MYLEINSNLLFYFLFVGIYCYLLYSCSGFKISPQLKVEFVVVVFYVISISIIMSFRVVLKPVIEGNPMLNDAFTPYVKLIPSFKVYDCSTIMPNTMKILILWKTMKTLIV